MSDRFSTSPALRLGIGSSRLRAALYNGLCVITSYALWSIYARGYPVSCLLLMPLSIGLLWRLRRDAAVGAWLCWQDGLWTLEQHGVRITIAPHRRCTVTPWAIYLAFTDVSAGATGSLWLYADSAPRSCLRQLRVRLTLLH